MSLRDRLAALGRRVPLPVANALVRLGRGARRLRGFVTVALLVAITATAAAVWGPDRRPAGDVTVGDVVRVGVAGGASIPEYEQRSSAELAGLAGTGPPRAVYALVTLRAYLAPSRLAPVVGDLAVSRVYARVPLPRLQTQIVRIDAFRVPDDVTGGMDQVSQRKAAEAAEYARLAANLAGGGGGGGGGGDGGGGGGDGERELRAVYAVGQEVAAAEATAYQEHCSCVYAMVVRASPAALSQLARRAEVRAVDPAPEVRRLDRAVFLPPLPEQSAKAGPPEGRTQPVASLTASLR